MEGVHPFTDLIGGGEPQVEEDGLPHFFKERRASCNGRESLSFRSLRGGCDPQVEEDCSFTYLRIEGRLSSGRGILLYIFKETRIL